MCRQDVPGNLLLSLNHSFIAFFSLAFALAVIKGLRYVVHKPTHHILTVQVQEHGLHALALPQPVYSPCELLGIDQRTSTCYVVFILSLEMQLSGAVFW